MRFRIGFRSASLSVAAAAALGIATVTGSAGAAIVNGGFEANNGDMSGWTLSGNVSAQAQDISVLNVAPPEGSLHAFLFNGTAIGTGADSPTSASTIESFLGLSSGALTNLNATNGSAMKQTFTAAAGDKITFKFDFLTNDNTADAAYADFGFVTLNGALTKLASTTTPGLSSGPVSLFTDGLTTGYQSVTLNVSTAGTYTLGFGVVNVGDEFVSSGLLVDQVAQTAAGNGGGGATVPLPAAVFLAPLGLATAGAWAKRIRRKA